MLRLNQSIGVREKGIRDKHFLVINIRIFLRNGRSFVCSRNIYRNILLFLTRIKFLIEDMFIIVTIEKNNDSTLNQFINLIGIINLIWEQRIDT